VEPNLRVALPVVLLLVAVSCFFALAESALFALGLWRAKRLADRDAIQGGRLVRLLAEPRDLVATLSFGNTLSNALLVAVTIVWLMSLNHPAWVELCGSMGVLLLVVLVCEVTPKALGVRRPEFWSLRVARPLTVLVRVTRPFRRLAQATVDLLLRTIVSRVAPPSTGVSDEEYADLIELAHQQGTLGAGEKEILLQILSLDERTARDVMKPRAQVEALPDSLASAEMIQAARKSGHHRIPLYDETPDNVIGVLNTRRLLLDPGADLMVAFEFASFVPESMNLLKLFEALQRQQRGLAIVLDEYGSMAGLVTLQDILAAVIGPIRAEGEPEGFVCEKLGEGQWRASGTMRLNDLRREWPTLGENEEVETVGGLVVQLAEVVPSPGDVFEFSGLRFTVRAADERRVREVLVEATGGRP
jgi:putative hemolysin